MTALDTPALVVLVGASASGKSTWAAEHFRRSEIVSSDTLREIVGTGEHDLDATTDAFAALDLIVAARLRRGLTTLIDTLGTDAARRRGWLALARAAGLPSVAMLFDTAADECRRRNRLRDRPVPATALTAQLRRAASAMAEVADEGWDEVIRVESRGAPRPVEAHESAPEPSARELRFVLQVSRFPWNDSGPAGWLTSVALSAAQAGFDGIALMDHLIQIPQVGRAWEPIPEPWVTLGLLAGLPTELQLGTLVSPVSLHSAGRLAKTAATLDALSGGRAFCGVGAGWWEREHLAFGLPFASPAQRVADLERALPIMRALWAPGTKAGAGLPETTSYPRPVGALPIIVGGRGGRVLAIASRLGDACNVPSDLETVDRAVQVMAGKRVTVLDVPVVGRDREHAAQLVERLRGRISAVAYARQHHAGTAAEHVARYRTLAARGVDTVFVAFPDLSGPDEIERFADVLAAFR
jgi:alkanesulfonate monooxygenase SsuD/methylene tetrahydromethanopterin reductase-like flavin-dependent oxidoreductase (luciferase family)/predicted kinase